MGKDANLGNLNLMKPVMDFLGKVLEKGGITGLLLVLLLGKIHLADKSAEHRASQEMARQARVDSLAREDRREHAIAYKAQSDSLISLARVQAGNEARGTDAMKSVGRALRDNTRVLVPVAQRMGIRVSSGGDGG